MPVSFLTEAERQHRSAFPNEIAQADLITYFTLSSADLAQIRKQRGSANRLGFALQLCALRYLGFIPQQQETIPDEVIHYVAEQLQIQPEALAHYGQRPNTRVDHLKAITQYLGFRQATTEDVERLRMWLVQRALEHDKPTLLMQMAGRWLHRNHIIQPGITVVERTVATARTQAYQFSYEQLEPVLTTERGALLDQILTPDPETGNTLFFWLKQHATSPSALALKATLEKLVQLQEWGIDKWDLTMLHPNRLKLLARIGRRSTHQALQRMPEARRYPILAAMVRQTLIDLTDEIVDLFDTYLGNTHTRAKRKRDEYRQSVARATETKVRLFHDLGRLVLNQAITDAALRAEIYQRISPEALEAEVDEAGQIMRPAGLDYFDFLDNHYSQVRIFAPLLLDTLHFTSNREADPLLEGLEIVKALNESRKRLLPPDAPTAFIPGRWRGYVCASEQPQRRAYELCLLSELRDHLRSGDIYLPASRRYANPETYLIPSQQWSALKPEICSELELDATGQRRLHARADELKRLLTRVDPQLKRPTGIRVENSELIVPNDEGEGRPESAKALEALLAKRLPQVELTDLLIEVDQWTGFGAHFRHAGTSALLSPDQMRHLYATILALGSNMGLKEMAKGADLPYRPLAWTSTWYLRPETLKEATTALVNYQYRQPLARLWGSGTLSSSDGQRFPTRGKVANAAALPRYFGYGRGITFYTWTSDQYSQYGSKIISTTVRDATYVLDEILDNETELTILEHTTDTDGYTDLVFGLFDLLGLQFSPRIRDLGGSRLYRLKGDATVYPNLEVRLRGRVNLDRIGERWDDLLRVAGSLNRGYVTASLLISKLQSYPRQNNLTRILQEYGRLCKTIFILRYLEDEAFRRRIEIQLNKGEQLHKLRRFLFFVREGKIQRKHLETQTDQALCLNVLTNAVIVWNTIYMQAAIEALRAEGMEVRDEDLVHISPARFEHINRYGKYRFDVEAGQRRKGLRPLRG